MLSLKDITKDYDVAGTKVHALKGVTIDFRKSEFVSILGPSGCGKTTLLNIIGGLDRYTNGDMSVASKSTKDFKDSDWDSYRNHSIGFVFQSYNLIPHQTVLSNVELALTLSGVSKAERRERAKKVLEQVGLGDQLNKKPNQMSGGQMQRVAIARALVNDPEILLADEPTGALDTETSVQIMELLKEISNDKLIIMVTHNPELAMKYSSRIIKLLDGKVIDDSDPFEMNVIEPIKQVEVKEVKKKKEKKLRTSMSFWTALSLSKNNLLTKKARTFLTSFAGSIGIIGIALILSLSNGVQMYIDQVQSDTLSQYPLQITKTTTNMADIMKTMSDQKTKNVTHDKTKIYSQNKMGEMVKSLLEETKVNNLEKLKKYLDNNNDIKELSTSVQYQYSSTLNVFKEDTSKDVTQVNPSSLLTDMGMYSEDQLSSISSMGMGSSDVWGEIIDNDKLIKSQYDVISGKLPEKYNEVILIVDENNEINDYVLYSLGMLDSSKLTDVMKKAMSGEKSNIDTKQVSYTYDELLNLKFKVVPSSDFYKKDGDIWTDMSKDQSYMKNVVNNGLELKVVGIVKPSKDATATSINGAIGYRHDLMSYIMDKADNSEIVKEQKASPFTDILTGLPFKSDSTSSSSTSSSSSSSSTASTDSSSSAVSQTKNDDSLSLEMTAAKTTTKVAANADTSSSKAAVSMDTSSMTDTQKKFMASLSDEQIKQMQEMMKEQENAAKKQTVTGGKTVSDSTYDNNMELLGYSVESSPSTINIYPKDFQSKEKITDIIDKYNQQAKDAGNENDTIEYTDYVGLMMSSVTTIINSISYILIAFVAISLVVSSIMIGIITYISVLERTKEIGILRSIGASKHDVSSVFNAETFIIGLFAGVLGIGISYLLTIPINAIIAHITDVPLRASIPYSKALILILISVLLTLIAGLFPSRIAAKKDPVIALRTE